MSSPLPLNPLEIYCHALSRRPPYRGGAASLWLSPCYRFQLGEGYLVVVEGQLSSRPCYRAEDRAASLPAFPLLQVPATQARRHCKKSRCRRCLVTSRRTELRRCPLSPSYRFQQSDRHSSASLSTTFPLSRIPAVLLSLNRQGRGGKEHGGTDPES